MSHAFPIIQKFEYNASVISEHVMLIIIERQSRIVRNEFWIFQQKAMQKSEISGKTSAKNLRY